jgi:signal transduction histidine kinase
MLITAEPHSLTSDKRAILDVLASQVAIEVETLQLVEEKIRLERELAHRERLATLGQMAAQVAHEVKNPLSSIKSIVQVMREEPAAAPYERDLRLIVAEIDRLNRTVSQLLAFSRPSRADAQPVGLSDLVHSTVTLVSAEAAERGVDVRAESDGDVQLEGSVAGALREALSNLVLNGVQACHNGDTVTIRAEMQGAQLVVEVTDDGPGIPTEDQQQVFEPFYSTRSRGTGLGLAIVQRRVTDIGAVLELTSPIANDRGTRFRITVPSVGSRQ